MRCAISEKRLTETFNLPDGHAELIRTLCELADDPCGLQDEVETNDLLDATESYVRRLYHSPYSSGMWRRTVVLHAIDRLVGGSGVSCPEPVPMDGPAFEFIEAGDSYATTLVYKRATDNLFIGSWIESVYPHIKKRGYYA